MSKKNLARTAIEGGRSRHYRFEEREFSLRERRAGKKACQRFIFDPESWYEDDVIVEREKPFGKDFADKLSPIVRWLDKQVGRPWSDVFSEISAKFPQNTLAGRHIVEHIEGFVNVHRDNPDRLVRVYDKPYCSWDGLAKKVIYHHDRILLDERWERRKDYHFFVIDSKGILRRNPDSPVPWRK